MITDLHRHAARLNQRWLSKSLGERVSYLWCLNQIIHLNDLTLTQLRAKYQRRKARRARIAATVNPLEPRWI